MPSILTLGRLREIEEIAVKARQSTHVFLAQIGFVLPVLWEMDTMTITASGLTNFIVEPQANLRDKGQRVAGLLSGENGQNYLRFEKFEPQARQIFSIAHELGHFFLHHNRDISGGFDIETEADAFAGAFLLNSDQLKSDLDTFGPCFPFLAKRYGLSGPVIKKRWETLQLLYSEQNVEMTENLCCIANNSEPRVEVMP